MRSYICSIAKIGIICARIELIDFITGVQYNFRMSEQYPGKGGEQPARSAREILDAMPSPTNTPDALAIILATEAAALEEGRTTQEASVGRLKDLADALKQMSRQQ